MTLEVTTMAGGLSRLPNVSMEMTVAEIKNRKDWPLIGIPPKRQLVLFEGRMLDNFLSLAANHVRTEGGARICLSVTVAKNDQGSMSPQRLKYLQKYMEFSAGAKTQSQEDAQKRRQEKARLLQEQRKREAEECRKEGILQCARDCEYMYYPLFECVHECDDFDRAACTQLERHLARAAQRCNIGCVAWLWSTATLTLARVQTLLPR